MQTLIVPGGAGPIGSCFARHDRRTAVTRGHYDGGRLGTGS